MGRVRVASFAVSLDGFGAGPDQSLEHPLGVGGPSLHRWFYPTRTFRSTMGEPGGTTGIDDGFARRGFENVGSWILGRNMFGPVRGSWDSQPDWRGWWGEEPPYHMPVFVLTHHARDPLEMKGGTTFYFVTDGIHAALERARDAAGEMDVRIGGGVSTIRQYLEGGMIDELHLVIAPVLLGSGEHLLGGLDLVSLGYDVSEHVPTSSALHVVLTRG